MSVFRKSYCNTGKAQLALQRAAWLRREGIRTPAGRPGQIACQVDFDRIAGVSGIDLLAAAPMVDLLAPLGMLQGVRAGDVPRFDPLLRIRPRLMAGVADWLGRALGRLRPATTGGTVLLHGDFHLGQLIRDRTGEVWLIDLDDLAAGPQEADLGNVIAHLATSGPAARGGFDRSLAFWRDAVLAAWFALGRGCDPALVDRFLRLALIRRHLKLREAGRPDFGEAICRYLSTP
ncbi:MAG: phosphotransferase [Paracoccaceae bacterium]